MALCHEQIHSPSRPTLPCSRSQDNNKAGYFRSEYGIYAALVQQGPVLYNRLRYVSGMHACFNCPALPCPALPCPAQSSPVHPDIQASRQTDRQTDRRAETQFQPSRTEVRTIRRRRRRRRRRRGNDKLTRTRRMRSMTGETAGQCGWMSTVRRGWDVGQARCSRGV